MILKPSAEATWVGPVLEGSGKVTTKSKVLENTSYCFVSRTSENNQYQTSPEEPGIKGTSPDSDNFNGS